MVKKPNLKERIFVSKISKTSPSTNSMRAIIPMDLLNKLKLATGDQVCWKLEESGKRLTCWKRTKKDKIAAVADDKIIDIKESPVKTDMKKISLSTQGAETQPQITATNHI